MAGLLKQFKDTENGLVRHFDIHYIQQGFDRLPTQERLAILPALLTGLSANYGESAKLAASLFNVFLKLLHLLEIPARGTKDDESLREKIGLQDEADNHFAALQLGHLMLFLPGPGHSAASRSPGLTTDDVEFLQNGKPETWMPSAPGGLSLADTKVRAAKLLATGAFSEANRLLPALVASVDANSRLSDVADDMLKRAIPAVSLEDNAVVEELLRLYLGQKGAATSPARPALKVKILGLLSKSSLVVSYHDDVSRLVASELPQPGEALGEQSRTKQGLEASKLLQAVFTFTHWIARMASGKDVAVLGPKLLDDLVQFINGQGWPTISDTQSRSEFDISARAQAYECIGLLAKKSRTASELLLSDSPLLEWLFSSLNKDSSGMNVSLSIENALSSLMSPFTLALEPQAEAMLQLLLLEFMNYKAGQLDDKGETIVRSARYVAVRFTNRCLPFHNTFARLINVMALANGQSERNEVVEEGRKGLDPYWYRNLNPVENAPTTTDSSILQSEKYKMPSFDKLIETMFTKKIELGQGLSAAVDFCSTVLLNESLESCSKAPVVDVEWSRNVQALIANDEEARHGVKKYLTTHCTSSCEAKSNICTLLEQLYDGMCRQDHGSATKCAETLLRLLPLIPYEIWKTQDSQLLDSKKTVFSNDHTLRSLSCHVMGILKCRSTTSQINELVEMHLPQARQWKEAVGSTAHQVHGSILFIAYLWSRAAALGHTRGAQKNQDLLFETVLEILSECKDKELLEAAITSIDQLSLFGCLGAKAASTQSRSDTGEPTSHDFVSKLEELAKKGDEKAVTALGHYAMLCPEEDGETGELNRIIEVLFALHEKRQPELHFAVGSALSCAAVGWSSKALVVVNDVDAKLTSLPRKQTLDLVLDRILKDCKQTKPALRAASVIWLLSIVQYCGHLEEVRTRLRLCQQAFKGFLADRESLNQEAASRGLTLVYEKGDKSIREDLVRDLIGSFTNTRSNLAGRVDQDTQLFEPGALPTGEGNSVTTYRDIMNLAGEVGDPSLVYRFMSLASNSSVWTSRAAFGRFGLGRLLADTQDGPDGALARNPKLYSSLFRYRFDPNLNVRSAMNEIWSAIVSNPTASVDAHFDAILDDLLKNILSKEWRTRQACCGAIADLVQGRPLEKYEPRLTEIWTMAFKVSDDIKDSVRVEAMSLAKTLTGILTRSLEAREASRKANAMLEQVLPFLLGPSGLESGAKDVQMIALVTLLDVIKKASAKALRPFLARLISHLVALLSSIEPEAVNYIHLNADKYGMTAAEIDDARLSSVRGSPMMEAIERCLDMLDETSMKELAPSLSDAIKTSIGLPSKVGASRTVVSLATRRSHLFRPYADGFLKLLRGQVLDRNDTVATAAAAACGYLARTASQDEVLRLFAYATRLFVESVDDRHRVAAGELVAAVAKHASDRFAAIGSTALPFAYLGMHDEHDEARELFKAAWEENTGGSRAVRLYLREILQLTKPLLESPKWSVSHASALTIANVVRAVNAGGAMTEADASLIWPPLEQAIGGKTWPGKEKVLGAVVLFAKSSASLDTNGEMSAALQVS